MDVTTFLAQIWGPIMFAVGLGFFVSRAQYQKIYRDLDNSALAGLTFGMVAMLFGIMHVGLHNAWDTFDQGLMSLLGWALLIKGAVFIIAPKLADRMARRFGSMKLIPVAGTFTLLIGAYVSYLGYFA